ncbi:helix-turn-helix domain-containing protein [Pedobacter hartonius]|uniref:Helix-turn-helix n=1 Tax=Pedobacter hartonius TaxID=425514 RepID=A0A1H4H6K7_9SPHI|nr:helix-turn-helix transcriptional regulator [Pedobacter hartonius]SEB17050.1 Helix-turn-helix [Pedobacter hartonius]
MQSDIFLKAKEKIRPEQRMFIAKNMSLIDQIFSILDEKGWSQKILANKLGKSESEVSKWLSGLHNFTLKSISKLESVLEQDLLITPLSISGKFTAQLEVHATKVYSDVVGCFTDQPTTIAYRQHLDITSNGKQTLILKEKKMIFDKPSAIVYNRILLSPRKHRLSDEYSAA